MHKFHIPFMLSALLSDKNCVYDDKWMKCILHPFVWRLLSRLLDIFLLLNGISSNIFLVELGFNCLFLDCKMLRPCLGGVDQHQWHFTCKYLDSLSTNLKTKINK